MAPTISLRRCFFVTLSVALSMLCCVDLLAAQISFDLPDTIECRDVTPSDFAASHPTLKVIEAKLRISARVIEGGESEIVDFLYIITSPDKRLRIQDYLPNTTLESQYERDRIEVTEASEDQKGRINEARVDLKSPQNDGRFHVYRWDWYDGSNGPPRVDFYLDGRLVHQSAASSDPFSALPSASAIACFSPACWAATRATRATPRRRRARRSRASAER